MMRKGLWSPDEDEKLKNCITLHRSGSWSDIARKAGLQRCGKSCRRRWMNHLRPDLKREKFTPDELQLVAKLHQTLGNKWSEIATYLVGRTDNDVKNLWNTQLKKQSRSVQHEDLPKRKGNELEGFPFSMNPTTHHMGQFSFQKPQLLLDASYLTNNSPIPSSLQSSSISASTFHSHSTLGESIARNHEVVNSLYKPLPVSTSQEGDHAQTSLLTQRSKLVERLACCLGDSLSIENMDSHATQNDSSNDINYGYYEPLNLPSMFMENIGKDQILDVYTSSSYDASQEGPKSSNESSASSLMVGDDTCSVNKPSLFDLHHQVPCQLIVDHSQYGQDQKSDNDTSCLSRGESWSSSSSAQWALETLIQTYEKSTWY